MPHIFWSACATHTINLMVEAISKISRFNSVIEDAKALTVFIYSHHKTLTMLRSRTKGRDIVRAGVTRFAYAFLSLQSLLDQRTALGAMFTSTEWWSSKFSKTAKGIRAYDIATKVIFWNGVISCLKVFAPLVRVLRLVDGDEKPAMAWVYGELRKAKEEIKVSVMNNVEYNYRPILEIIDSRMKDRLDSPLHLVCFLLNPIYLYKDEKIAYEQDVVDALIVVVQAFYPNQENIQDDIVHVDFRIYRNKEGPFGRGISLRAIDRSDYDPVEWWKLNGNTTPNLQGIALRVLGLTSSSSVCERNWSTFEGIHTKKRNKLLSGRLQKLVYIEFNKKIIAKARRTNQHKDDVLLANIGAVAGEGWIERGGDVDDDDDAGPSNLDIEDFESEDEEEVEEEDDMNLEFEEENREVRKDDYPDIEDLPNPEPTH